MITNQHNQSGDVLVNHKKSYVQAIAEVAAKHYDISIALHLDHHETYESIVESLELGTKSVMIDGSHHTFEENIAITKKVADKAHAM